MKILVIHGPNLNLLGSREPDVYGSTTLDEIDAGLKAKAQSHNIALDTFQSNAEHEIVSKIQEAMNDVMSDEIVVADDKSFFLHPGELALAVTYESVTLPANIVGWLDGRSSLARLGLMVHVTAHRIDPGWSGNIVLEFFNSGKLPLALKPGMKIGAISFEVLSDFAEKPYNSRADAKYRGQDGAIASRISADDKT